MTDRTPARRWWLLIAALACAGVALDQVTKAMAVAWLVPGRPVPLVSDLFSLALYRNPGAAFSAGSNFTIGFSILAAVVLVLVCDVVVPRVRTTFWAVVTGLGLSGVAGNFIDRLFQPPAPLRGHVIDFFSLKYFAVFNVADIALTVAAGLVIANLLFWKHDLEIFERRHQPGEGA